MDTTESRQKVFVLNQNRSVRLKKTNMKIELWITLHKYMFYLLMIEKK